jgi:hypothetical protein
MDMTFLFLENGKIMYVKVINFCSRHHLSSTLLFSTAPIVNRSSLSCFFSHPDRQTRGTVSSSSRPPPTAAAQVEPPPPPLHMCKTACTEGGVVVVGPAAAAAETKLHVQFRKRPRAQRRKRKTAIFCCWW